jgi:hypothetical protein
MSLDLLARRALCRAPAPLALAASLLAVAGPLSAQGETGFFRGEGHLDAALSGTFDSYDEFWVGIEDVSDPGVGEVERTSVSLYLAYGLSDDLDLIGNAAWVSSESDGAAGAPGEDDLQDFLLAAKWRAWHKPTGWGEMSLSLLPGIKLPLTDYEDNDITAHGDGQVDLRGRVVLHAQHTAGWYASFETGYDHRNGAPEDEIPMHLQAGMTFFERITVSPFVSRVESLGGNDIGDPGFTFPENEEDYTRAGIKAYAKLGAHMGITAGWHTTLDGRNTGDVTGFTVGLVYSM